MLQQHFNEPNKELSTVSVDKSIVAIADKTCRLKRAGWKKLLALHFNGSVRDYRIALEKVAAGKAVEPTQRRGLLAIQQVVQRIS